MSRRVVALILVVVVLGTAAFWAWPRTSPLPADLRGALVFVSDRGGPGRALPPEASRRARTGASPSRGAGPRAGLLARTGRAWPSRWAGASASSPSPSGDVRILTLGVDWRDASPAWRPDGQALVVVRARAGRPTTATCTCSSSTPRDGQVAPRPRSPTAAASTREPAVLARTAPSWSACARTTSSGSPSPTAALAASPAASASTGRRASSLRVGSWLSGRRRSSSASTSWTPDGKNRETLSQGTALYRSVAPSPDGRYFAATFTFDLGFHPAEALKLRKTEEVRLLDAHGRPLGARGALVDAANHSPDWAA